LLFFIILKWRCCRSRSKKATSFPLVVTPDLPPVPSWPFQSPRTASCWPSVLSPAPPPQPSPPYKTIALWFQTSTYSCVSPSLCSGTVLRAKCWTSAGVLPGSTSKFAAMARISQLAFLIPSRMKGKDCPDATCGSAALIVEENPSTFTSGVKSFPS
jgi:hypothetical protein